MVDRLNNHPAKVVFNAKVGFIFDAFRLVFCDLTFTDDFVCIDGCWVRSWIHWNDKSGTSRAGRVRVMSQRMAESASQRDFFGNAGMHYMANQSTASRDETPEDLFHDQHLALQERMRNPIAFHAKMMGDIMYLNQALQQSDGKKFVQAVVKEVNGHVDSNNWTLKKRSKVPDDAQIVPSVWSMWRKRDLTTNQVKSHKA